MDILKKRINDIYSKNIKQRKVDNDNLNKYGLQGITLRDYQVDGVNWLIERYHRDHGCILADEMGLGKTCQTISFLVYLFGSGETAGPHLILSPLSVLSNWHSELTRFAPKLHCVVYQGTKEQRSKLAMEMTKSEKIINVVLTTYEICLKDESFLRRFGEWRTLVVDEAHRLKNSESLLYKVLQEFDIDHRILLTGTPIQNNMQELYSLLRFTTPGIFKEKYMQTFLDTYASETALQAKGLQSLLKPFLLRRIKSEVVRDLPQRSEVILYHGMSATQKRYYRALLAKDTEAFDNPNKTTKTRLMNILVQLRKCVNHPYLFDGVEPEPFVLGEHLVEASGKLFLLDQLLLHLHSHGHKVLLFSQMTRVLDILQDYLGYRGYNYERLDGSVRGEERYLAVQNFNKDDDTFIFLLSTRAGGVGLNLVAADTVIFMDSDFNPQNDLQAAARAHRIGQTRPVKIVRLVGRSTVEEIVLKRASAKLKLTHDVIGSHKFSTVDDKADLVAEDSFQLSDILKFGVDKLFSSDESSIEDVDFDTLLGGSKDGEWMSDEVAGATQAQSLGVEEDEVEEAEAASGSASMYVYEGTDYKNAASTEDQKAFDELIAVEQAMQEASLSGTGRPMRRGGDGSLVGELPSLTKTRVPLTAEQLEERKKKKEEAAERRQKMEEDAVVRREAARKKRLLALWTANSYSSLNVTLDSEGEEVEDEEEGASGGLLKLDMENEEDGTSAQDIKYVVGDVTRPKQKDDLSAITVHCVDDSGGWGSGGVFSAISRHAPNIEKHYEHAGEMKDLSLGDAHLLPVEGSSDPQHYYAIVVAQHRDRKNNLSGIKLTALSDSLQRIYKAAIDLKASVHFPRIGHRTPGFNWYGTERLIRKHISRKGIPTYIYYYPRKQQKADPEKQKADPEQGTSSSLKRKKCDVDSSSQSESDTESPPKHVRFSFMGKTNPVTKSTSTEDHSTKACTLPNFMLGVQVAFHTSVKAMDVQSLRRYLVAYGGKLPTELTANTSHLCVSAENGSIGGEEELSQIAKDNPAVIIVSTNWLKASFRKQQQVNVAPYIHPKAK